MLLFLSLFAIVLAEGTDEKPCMCVTTWTDESCDGEQKGCPDKACDDPSEPRWCLTANDGCAEEDPEDPGWFVCDSDSPVFGASCTSCSCNSWDGSNYSNCRAVTKEHTCTGYCVSCEMDGKTAMPGFYTNHKQECAKYEQPEAEECTDKVGDLRAVLYDDEATCATAIQSYGDQICSNDLFSPYCCACKSQSVDSDAAVGEPGDRGELSWEIEAAVAALPTCSCAGGNQEDTKNGDTVCEWRGGNCSKFREGCGDHGATVCEMQKAKSGVAVVTTSRQENLAVYAFAAIGFSVVLFGSYKHYCAKSEETISINML